MRTLEVILFILAISLPFFLSVNINNFPKRKLLIAILLLLFAHLILEGIRWQMAPIYLIIIILCWCIYKELIFFKGGWVRKGLTGLGLFLALFIGCFLSNILPVFKLPKPTGNYNIGSRYIHLETNLDEIITQEIGDKRELMIKVWYPAILKEEIAENYLNAGDRVGFAAKYGLPKSTFNYLDYVKTHTYPDAEVANGKFPVLIFSHGLYSKASGYYALLEEIVSQGYIVININHTYESVGTLFLNGEIKLFNTEYDLKNNNEEMGNMVWEAMKKYNEASSWGQKHKAIEHSIRSYAAADINTRWVEDISLVIGELEDWNKTTFLKNHLDISKLGAMGHSQGGAAAAHTMLIDDRIKAAINIDGMQWGSMIDSTLSKPFALISSDWSELHPNWNEHAYHNGSTSDFIIAKVLNSGHPNFMDIPLMINLKLVNEAGSIDPYLANDLTSKVVLSFFEKHLNDKKIDILTLSEKHSELEIKLHDKSNSSILME